MESKFHTLGLFFFFLSFFFFSLAMLGLIKYEKENNSLLLAVTGEAERLKLLLHARTRFKAVLVVPQSVTIEAFAVTREFALAHMLIMGEGGGEGSELRASPDILENRSCVSALLFALW
jgi:hypothetical protein